MNIMNLRISKKIRYTWSILGILSLFLLIQGCDSANTEKLVSDFRANLDLMKKYDFAQSHAWQEDFQNIMVRVYNNKSSFAAVEALMIDALKDDITPAAKQMICSYLAPVASDKAIPVLRDMLEDQQLSAIALACMQYIPDPKVDLALMEALPVSGGLTKAGIVNVLALRRETGAINAISGLIHDPDPRVSRSAIDALGRIGTTEAAAVLDKSFHETQPPLKWSVSDAWLLCADNMASEDPAEALSIYTEIYNSGPPLSILHASLKGILRCDMDKGEKLLLNLLGGGDPEVQTMVMPLVGSLKADADLSAFLDLLPGLDEYQQMQLFSVLADRKDPGVKEIVKKAVNHDNPDIRLAALMALRDLGGASDVDFLASVAVQSRGRERDMARECLEILKGPDIDAVIIQGLQNPDPGIRVEFIRSIGERNLKKGIDPVLGSLKDPDRKVRLEAYKSLGKLSGPEQLNSILQASLEASSSAELNEAERTITLVAQKIQDESKRVDHILTVLPEVQDDRSLIMLIQAMGDIGCEQALPVIRGYLKSDKLDIQIASIRALSVWPDAAPLDDLRQIIESSDDVKAHNLAMNGYVRMIQIDDAMSEEEKSEAFQTAFELAGNIDEQRIVVSGLSKVRARGALQMAVGLLDNPGLRSEAEAAIAGIARPLGNRDPEYTRAELNKIIETTDNDEFRARLQEILKWMD